MRNDREVVVPEARGLTMHFAVNGPPYLTQEGAIGSKNAAGSTTSFDKCVNRSSSSSSTLAGGSGGGTVNFDGGGTAGTLTPPANPIDLSDAIGS